MFLNETICFFVLKFDIYNSSFTNNDLDVVLLLVIGSITSTTTLHRSLEHLR